MDDEHVARRNSKYLGYTTGDVAEGPSLTLQIPFCVQTSSYVKLVLGLNLVTGKTTTCSRN